MSDTYNICSTEFDAGALLLTVSHEVWSLQRCPMYHKRTIMNLFMLTADCLSTRSEAFCFHDECVN